MISFFFLSQSLPLFHSVERAETRKLIRSISGTDDISERIYAALNVRPKEIEKEREEEKIGEKESNL